MRELPRAATHDDMLRRIRGEYLEMPGLRLKREQAQRLWSLDEATCATLLDALVEAGFLCRLGGGAYARLTEGSLKHPPLQMAKATLDVNPSLKKGKASTAA